MANDLWTTVEDAVLAALKGELDAQVKTLATYQGDWLTDLHREDWRFPAVLVQLRQSRGEQVTLSSYDLNLEFTVLVLVRHLRGEAAGPAGGRWGLPGPGGGEKGPVASGSGAGVATPQSHQGRAVVEQPGIFRVRGPLRHRPGAGPVKLTRREDHDPVHPEFFSHP